MANIKVCDHCERTMDEWEEDTVTIRLRYFEEGSTLPKSIIKEYHLSCFEKLYGKNIEEIKRG